jgi:LiaI-LiaF-like transmembrane region
MMQCPTCADSTVTAFCRECGKGVCEGCMARRDGVSYCPDCAPAVVAGDSFPPEQEHTPPPSRPASVAIPPHAPASTNTADGPHPFLAGLLGFVPGLGAVYNGQYVKGIVHAAIFGMLIAISTSADHEAVPALIVPMVVFFVLYMPIEAVRTAQAIRRGEEVNEMSGIVGALFDVSSDSPVPGILFIAAGVIFLLFTLGILRAELVFKAWPLILVGLGVWRLYASTRRREDQSRHAAPQATSFDTPE